MSALRATLRIARRDALRSRGRSALVVAMIALPVLGVTAVDVAARTFELTPEQRAVRTLGTADASVFDSGYEQITQTAKGEGSASDGTPLRAGEVPYDVSAALPPGSRSLPDLTRRGRVSAGGSTLRVEQRALDYTDPLARGIFRQISGRPPRAPTEVAVTPKLADRLDLALGSTLVLDEDGTPRTVVGLVQQTSLVDAETVVVPAGSLRPEVAVNPYGVPGGRLLVDVPGDLTWAQVLKINDVGLIVAPRGSVPGAPPEPRQSGQATTTLAAVVLVAGMALLEVVLLAGPAFAVGAKRSGRQLALVAATGGDRRDVRRTVLGGGLVLGVAAGVVGAVGGVALAGAAVPFLGRLTSEIPGPFEVRPFEVAAIALVGVGTALLAAWLPARAAARQDVVAALTGRRGTTRGSRGVPAVGVVAALLGVALALEGARRREVLLILAGSALAELGLVAMTPALVGAAGRFGRLLPVAPRLALRDAARNRGRTAPAVAAIMAAVAGSVAVGTYVASLDLKDRQAYRPSGVPGSVQLSLYGEGGERSSEIAAVLRREFGTDEVVEVRSVGTPRDGRPSSFVELAVPGRTSSCLFEDSTEPTPPAVCDRNRSYFAGTVVGDASVVKALTGADDPAVAKVLAAGGLVVPARYLASDATATLVVYPSAAVSPGNGRRVVLPAVALPDSAHQSAVLSAAAAALLDVGDPVISGLVVRTTSMPTKAQENRARNAVETRGVESSLYVERGYVSNYGPGLIALAAVSALLTLGASAIATGLAAADGKADLATLAAVGATPGMRRRLAGSQSLVIAGLGTGLGVVAGLVPAIGLVRAMGAPVAGVARARPFPLVIPWERLAVTGLVVPLVAGLAAVLLTRSRLPLVRRLA